MGNEVKSLPEISRAAVLESAPRLLSQYRETIAAIPPEAGFGGIWESEMFLFYAAVYPYAPEQILESGRARGKSTLMLAHCFPNSRIVSVEFDRDSESAAAAEAKLKPYRNVELLYGDSRQILPQRVQTGDAILIDGPKGFRAIELALELLRKGNPCAVFIHDCPQHTPWRKYIERNWPTAFFGDDPAFQSFRSLDQGRDPREAARNPEGHGYGIFACLPGVLPASYWRLQFALLRSRLTSRSGT